MGNSSGDLREFLRNAEALKRQEERVSELQASYDAQTDVAKKAELETELSAAKAEYTSRHQAYTAAKEAEEKASDAYETAAENLETATKQNDRIPWKKHRCRRRTPTTAAIRVLIIIRNRSRHVQ